MAIQETNLGHFDYIAFHHKDATLSAANNVSFTVYNWKWQIPPSLNRRKAPYWFLTVVSCYLDDSGGSSTGLPHFLRCKIPAENYHSIENPSNTQSTNYVTYPIVSQLIRDVAAGHWYSISQDNVVIQVPSNLQFIEFDILDGNSNVIQTYAATGENLNILCKITYPARMEITDNINQTFIQTINPKMTPHFAFTN